MLFNRRSRIQLVIRLIKAHLGFGWQKKLVLLGCGAPAMRSCYFFGIKRFFYIFLYGMFKAQHNVMFELEVYRIGIDPLELNHVSAGIAQSSPMERPAAVVHQLAQEILVPGQRRGCFFQAFNR